MARLHWGKTGIKNKCSCRNLHICNLLLFIKLESTTKESEDQLDLCTLTKTSVCHSGLKTFASKSFWESMSCLKPHWSPLNSYIWMYAIKDGWRNTCWCLDLRLALCCNISSFHIICRLCECLVFSILLADRSQQVDIFVNWYAGQNTFTINLFC